MLNKKILFFLILSLSFLSLNVSAQVPVIPDPNQGAEISSPGFTQTGDTCQQATWAMAFHSLGLKKKNSTSYEVYKEMILDYGETRTRNCFLAAIRYLMGVDNSSEIKITGGMGGSGKDETHRNKTDNKTIKVTYAPKKDGHPDGKILKKTLRIVSLTLGGSTRLAHNIIVVSVDKTACFPLAEIKTADGKILSNVKICPLIYWDPNFNSLVGSFITSSGNYISVDGKWEKVIGTATIKKS